MSGATQFFEGRSKDWNANTLFNLNHLNSRVQLHLQKVYGTLCLALLASASGVYVHMLLNIGGLLTALGFAACTAWLMSTPVHEERKKWNILMGAAFLEGASVGTLLQQVIDYDPSIAITAFLGTVAIFASFSGAALFAKRREFLFLGGILSSALSTMLMLRFGSYIFGGASAMFNLELYVGLLVFVGYVMFDTQLIVEKADKGDNYYVQHSLDLFMDFASIFIRILIILTKNSKERKENERERKRRS